MRDEASFDQRPRLGPSALKVGLAAPPSDGLLDTSAEYVRALGTRNWLEGRTLFGPRADYAEPSTAAALSGLTLPGTEED